MSTDKTKSINLYFSTQEHSLLKSYCSTNALIMSGFIKKLAMDKIKADTPESSDTLPKWKLHYPKILSEPILKEGEYYATITWPNGEILEDELLDKESYPKLYQD